MESAHGQKLSYGTPPDEATMAKIKAPVLGFYGCHEEAGESFEPHLYPHGTHGFLEYQEGGNPQATSDSWRRTIAFLKQHTG